MKKTILAVDDSATIRLVLQTALEDAGYQVILASDGQEALSKFTPHSIDMVLTDQNMPNMDGLSLVREIRSQAEFRFKPILMLTSNNQPDIKKIGKEVGVSCWLTKPFSPERLTTLVKTVLPY